MWACRAVPFLDFVIAVIRFLDMTSLHHDLRRCAVHILLEPYDWTDPSVGHDRRACGLDVVAIPAHDMLGEN